MINQESREILYFKIPVFIADCIIHGLILFLLVRFVPTNHDQVFAKGLHISLLALLLVSFSLSMSIIGLKLHKRSIRPLRVLWRAFMQSASTYVLFAVLLAFVYKATPRVILFYGFTASSVAIMLWHYVASRAVRMLRWLGHNTRNVLFIGADSTALMLYNELKSADPTMGYRVAGFFTSLDEVTLPEGAQYLGTVDDFFEWSKTNSVEEIYCSLPPVTCEKGVNRIIKICNERLIDFSFVPTMDGYPHRQMAFRNVGKVTIIKLREEPLNSLWAKFGKRAWDILVSSLFLFTIYPFVVLFVWLGNKLTGSHGPLYFRQARTGYNGKPFMIYKFRSMKVNAEADTLQATEDDPRKTKFGDFLRRSSIDELPQFINVLKGDMTIIGPRPHMEYHTEVFGNLISDYMVRHLAKPGITGWAQINGCRGETKTVEEMKDRVEHDIWYIEHWTPLLDVEIFFRTIWQVMPGRDKQAY